MQKAARPSATEYSGAETNEGPWLAAGGRRGLGLNEERDQTLNQLLTELDGFEARPGVLLLAATNRTEVGFWPPMTQALLL